MAGPSVMPRPPGPVTTQTPSSGRCPAHQLVGVDALAVDTSPALTNRRKRTAEKLLDHVDQVGVWRFGHVEGERLVVLVGVADRQPAVQPLYAQQLHAVFVGDCILGLVALQRIQRLSGEAGVVAKAVAVGDRGGQRLVQRLGLHHLQAHPPNRQFACDLADQPAMRGARAHQHQVTLMRVAAVVEHGGARRQISLRCAE